MRRSRIAAAFCALVLSLPVLTAAAAPAPLLGRYSRYDAGEYVIVSSRSAAQARRIMEDLAKFQATLERMLGKRATRSSTPTTILITGTPDWDQWFKPLEGVTGYFRPGSFSNHMALDGDSSIDETLHVVFHEFTHYYLATRFAGDYPPWFNEGLAELMGYAHFERGMATLRIPTFRLNQARDGQWIPFERLIRVDHSDPEYQSHQLMPSFYAQSWLTVHYAMVANPEFRAQVFDYLAQLNMLVPQEEAARKAFGDLSTIDRKLYEYARTRVNSGAWTLGEIPAVQIATGEPMEPVESMALIADLMLDAAQSPRRVAPLIQGLEMEDPNKARPAVFMARVAQREGDSPSFDAAVARAQSALEPRDWRQRRELGYLLLTNALIANQMPGRSKDVVLGDVKRAMNLFAEAVAANGEDVETLWGYGASAVYLGIDLDRAEQSLLEAYGRAPTNADIAAALANLKSQQRDPDGMVPYLKDVIRFATDLQTRRWATNALIATEKFIEERDAKRR